jgi:hypothetical protein
MSSRHWRCSPGVEPRLAARHLAKNPPPASYPQAPVSDARSLAASSLPAARSQHETAHSPPACICQRRSVLWCMPSSLQSSPTRVQVCNRSNAIARNDSVLRPPGFLDIAVSIPCKYVHSSLSHFWGSLHTENRRELSSLSRCSYGFGDGDRGLVHFGSERSRAKSD